MHKNIASDMFRFFFLIDEDGQSYTKFTACLMYPYHLHMSPALPQIITIKYLSNLKNISLLFLVLKKIYILMYKSLCLFQRF